MTDTQRKDCMVRDIVVMSVRTTVAPSMGGKRGILTSKETSLHISNYQCLEIPYSHHVTLEMIADGDQPPPPQEEVDTGMSSGTLLNTPSTSPHAPPTPPPRHCVYSQGGVCSLHGPGALKKWRPRGRKTIVDAVLFI